MARQGTEISPRTRIPDPTIPPQVMKVAEDLLPDLRRLTDGRYGVAVSGSIGKGTFDESSDIDYRYFYDAYVDDPKELKIIQDRLVEKMGAWGKQGVVIDGYYARKICDIDAAIESRLAGNPPPQLVWTVWGYHLFTDLANMKIIEDPRGVLTGWHRRLSVFPPAYKTTILQEYTRLLSYWRDDYHYHHKTEQGDVVFCAGLTAKLVNAVMRIVYALNETYYPGDGKNLELAAEFPLKPTEMEDRVRQILFIEDRAGALSAQRERMVELIDLTLSLVKSQQS